VGILQVFVELWLNEVCDITSPLSLSSVEKLSCFWDTPAAFCLHFVSFLQVYHKVNSDVRLEYEWLLPITK